MKAPEEEWVKSANCRIQRKNRVLVSRISRLFLLQWMGDVKRDASVERGDSLIEAYPWRTMCYEHIFYPPTQIWGRGEYVLHWDRLGVPHECSAVRDAVV